MFLKRYTPKGRQLQAAYEVAADVPCRPAWERGLPAMLQHKPTRSEGRPVARSAQTTDALAFPAYTLRSFQPGVPQSRTRRTSLLQRGVALKAFQEAVALLLLFSMCLGQRESQNTAAPSNRQPKRKFNFFNPIQCNCKEGKLLASP